MRLLSPGIIVLSALLLYSSTAHGERQPEVCPFEGGQLTLIAAVQTALQQSPIYSASQSTARAAAGMEQQSGLWSNPQVFMQTEEWPADRSFEESRYIVGVAQTVPFPGKKKYEHLAGRHSRISAEYNEVATRAALIRDIRVAFYRSLSNQELLQTMDSLLEVTRKSMQAAEERLRAGAVTPQEVLRTEIALEHVKNQISQLEQEQLGARSELAVLLGVPGASLCTVTGSLAQSAPAELLDLTQGTFAAHPLIKAAEARVARARAEAARAELDPYPDVTLRVGGGRREINNETLIDFGISVPVPLLDASRGRQKATHELWQKSQADLTRIRQSLGFELTRGIERLKSLSQQIANFEKRIIPKTQNALTLIQSGFREGEYSLNDLLDTQRSLVETQIVFQQKLLELNTTIAEVESIQNPDKAFEENRQ